MSDSSGSDKTKGRRRRRRLLLLAGAVVAFFALGGGTLLFAPGSPYQIQVMPLPELFTLVDLEEVLKVDGGRGSEIPGILYVTDRAPLGPGDDPRSFYANRRGSGALRAGLAEVTVQAEEAGPGWDQVRRILMDPHRPTATPLEITSVEEMGILDRTATPLDGGRTLDPGPREAFLEAIRSTLDGSALQDVVLFVHGFNVQFPNPVLLASELWSFMSFQGAFIAYSWPSTQGLLAYPADVETAVYSGTSLRQLIQLLARESAARKIHLIGYSAGSRVVSTALHQLALMPREDLRLGTVLFIASDVDRAMFGQMMADGMGDVAEQTVLYTSPDDGALAWSRRFFAQERTGQTLDPATLPPPVLSALNAAERFHMVDVSGAPGVETGQGHSYYRSSPWVSTDLLLSLGLGLTPGQRGLVREAGSPIWRFPTDYPSRLRDLLDRGLLQPDSVH